MLEERELVTSARGERAGDWCKRGELVAGARGERELVTGARGERAGDWC